MKHNLEKKFSSFDLILVLALIAVLIVNIVVSRGLPAPGMRKASKDAVTVTGTAPGKVGDVTVERTADKDNIYSVAVTDQNETPGIGSLAVEQLPAAIVSANSLAVDSVSSATVTSEAIKIAAAAALAAVATWTLTRKPPAVDAAGADAGGHVPAAPAAPTNARPWPWAPRRWPTSPWR